MLTAASASEIFSAHKDFATVDGIVQHEICLRRIVSIIPPVTEQVIAKSFPFCCLQKTGRDDLVSVYILDGQWNCGAL